MKQWVWQHEQRKTHTYIYICWKDLSGFFLKLCWKQHALHTVIYFALKSSIDKLPGWVFGSRVIENMPMTCNNDTCQHFAYWVWSSNLCERCSCTVKPTSMLLPLHSTGYSVQRTNEKCSSTHADHCWRSLASTGLPHCHWSHWCAPSRACGQCSPLLKGRTDCRCDAAWFCLLSACPCRNSGSGCSFSQPKVLAEPINVIDPKILRHRLAHHSLYNNKDWQEFLDQLIHSPLQFFLPWLEWPGSQRLRHDWRLVTLIFLSQLHYISYVAYKCDHMMPCNWFTVCVCWKATVYSGFSQT